MSESTTQSTQALDASTEGIMPDKIMEEMMAAGVHLGHAKTKNHPSMQKFLFGVRNTISLIDLAKTKDYAEKAFEFIQGIANRGGMVLLVGTRPAARKAILEIAEKTRMPYFVERWIGGTLTNFPVITARVQYMEQLERERASGDFEKYTKKEKIKKEHEIERLKKNFDGLRTLKRLPDAVFIVDITEDTTAVSEARKKNIPIVALCDTNSNANVVDVPIPSNDDALPAVRYMVTKIGEAILEGQRASQASSEGK